MDASFPRKLDEAWRGFAAVKGRSPSIGIILGSGLGDFAAKAGGIEVPFSSLPGFPRPTVQGHSGLFKVGKSVVVMAGRVHYYEGHPMDDVVLPTFILHRLGVRTLIVTNASGGINRAYSPGELVLIRDHINLMGVHPLRGPNPDLGPRFPDMTSAYDPELRRAAQAVSPKPLHEGVYAALTGPSFETPAEIRMLEVLGADMVGMSTVPEAIVASYLGMKVLGISCVTNPAAGILDKPLNHHEVLEAGREAGPRFMKLLTDLIPRLGGSLGEG